MRTNKAKQQAILDIQADLARENKCFFSFVKKLNDPIGALVTEHINEQMKLKSKNR